MLLLAVLAAVCAAGGSASGAVGVGSSGWYWGNPLPQGNDLHGIAFLGSRGFAVGRFGTVLRSDDGGATWIGLASGTRQDLNQVQVLSPSTAVVAGGCSVLRTDDGGATFRALSVIGCPGGNVNVASFAFASPTVGWFGLADGTLVSTADGGSTFSRRTSPSPSVPALRLIALNPTTVVALTQGAVLRSTNGGDSWTQVASAALGFRDMTFAGATGYVVGAGGTFLKSIDAGVSWSPVSGMPGNVPLERIACGSAQTCTATVSSQVPRVVVTQDGGASFSAVAPLSIVPELVSLSFAPSTAYSSPASVVATGAFGATARSIDAGATFAPIGGGVVVDVALGSEFIRTGSQAGLAYTAGASGRIARTVDFGKSWQSIDAPTSDAIVDLSFPTPATGFVLTGSGRLLKTTSGGSSYVALNTGASSAAQGVLAPSAGTVLLVGPRGVRRSTNGGASFRAVTDADVSRAKVATAEMAGKAIIAQGARSLALSTNAGATWSSIRLPSRRPLLRAALVDAKTLWALDAAGYVFLTRNGGKAWTESLAVGAASGNARKIRFSDAKRGYLLLSGFGRPGPTGGDLSAAGVVLRTSDAGKTWRPEAIDPFALSDLRTGKGGTDYASAASLLFATQTGGDQGIRSALAIKTKKATVKRGQTIKIQGKLSPPQGGEEITVSQRTGGRWTSQTVRAASDGSFTTSWRLLAKSVYVAQWPSDGRRTGAGSKTLTVDLASRKAPK